MGQHSLHFNVTWDITCADTGCASGEGTICKTPKSSEGPHPYYIPLITIIDSDVARKKLKKCANNFKKDGYAKWEKCTYDVLAKALDCDINSVLDTLEGLLDDGALTAITPTRQICKCVGEDEELDACGALCEWEAAGRAAAFNNDNNKKLLSN
tara:strand:+ start:781 stop:1242 length:462 start_codon:yes stop_codon:yes gene_type:complete